MVTFIKIITFPLSIIFWIVFALILVVFHGIQWLSFNLFGYRGLKHVVDFMNLLLLRSVWLAGVHYTKKGKKITKEDAPTIIVSNHQSMFDVSPIIWFLRALHPKFVAKAELGRGFPGISYNLRHGGSILIDRKDRSSALKMIKSMGDYIVENKRSAVIFPEGTRSDSPTPKTWKTGGLQILLKSAPTVKVLPVTIKGSWKILKNKGWPVPFGTKIEIVVHDFMERGDTPIPEFIEEIREVVESYLDDGEVLARE